MSFIQVNINKVDNGYVVAVAEESALSGRVEQKQLIAEDWEQVLKIINPSPIPTLTVVS